MKKTITLVVLAILVVSAIVILKSKASKTNITNKVAARQTYTNKWQSREYLFDIMHSLSNQYPDVEYSADLEETVQLLIDAIPNKQPFTPMETVTHSQVSNIIIHVYPESYTLRSKKYEYLKKNIFTNGVTSVTLTELIDKLVKDKNNIRFDLRFKSLVPHMMNKIMELHRINPDLADYYSGLLNSQYYPDANIGSFIINRIIPKDSPMLTKGEGHQASIRSKYSLVSTMASGGYANPDCLPLIITILNNPDKFTGSEWRYTGTDSLSQYTNDIVVLEAEKAYKVLKNRKKYWTDPLMLRYFYSDYKRGYDIWMDGMTVSRQRKLGTINPPVYDEEPWRSKL